MGIFERKDTDTKAASETIEFDTLRREKMRGEQGLEQRKKNERAVKGAKIDGRSLKKTGRTEQFNTKCKPEFKERVIKIAQHENISMGEVIERAVLMLEKNLKL